MRNITADHKISVLKNLTDRFKSTQFKRFTDAGASVPEDQRDADVIDAVLTAADVSSQSLSDGVLDPIFDIIMDDSTREEILMGLVEQGYELADISDSLVTTMQQDLLGAILPPVLVLYLQQVIPYVLRASISGMLATERIRAEHFFRDARRRRRATRRDSVVADSRRSGGRRGAESRDQNPTHVAERESV